jgi:aspartate/methionine/tyrosine aminotransferase
MHAYQEEGMESLTAWQIRSLRNRFNLSDGHARDRLLEAEVAAIEGVTGLISAPYLSIDQDYEEDLFVQTFMTCAEESMEDVRRHRIIFQYSASSSISLVGASLASLRLRSIGVLHPSFDNIPQLLARRGLRVVPIQEPSQSASDEFSLPDGIDALFITMPNNPTGWVPTQALLATIATSCAERGLPLIVDLTFRFQGNLNYSVYSLLANVEGLELVTIEDTGKTWNLNDMKCSFMAIRSERLERVMGLVSEELLLNVSPSLISMIRRIISVSAFPLYEDSSPLRAKRLLAASNRQVLRDCIAPAPDIDVPDTNGFVAWVSLPPQSSAVIFAASAERNGVSILPGDEFLWADTQPSPHLRVALLREPEYFAQACDILGTAFVTHGARSRI